MAQVTEDVAKEAEKIKNEANQHFQSGHFLQAIDLYSKAISLNPNVAIYYSNRAFAYTRLEQYGAALEDSSKSIELDPKYVKGYYRRGSANLALGKHKEALKDFKKVVQIYPKNQEALEKLKNCEKAVRQLAFTSAIHEESETASENFDPKTLEVESSYSGPHLSEPITVEFMKDLLAHLKDQKKLHIKYVFDILSKAKNILSSLPTLITIEAPKAGAQFTVCGDTHGQFYDLLNIFEINGLPSETNPYLFNGDFVDRGSFSFEVVFTLLAFKVLFPNHLHLTRGNHESLTMNRMYGFEGEVVSKYNRKVFDLFTEVFCWLPLAAVIGGKVLVVHGGLFSRDGVTLEDIKNINRNRQPPDEGLMCELLWSDPSPFPGRSPNKRGVGVAFGPDVTKKFLKDNGLELLVRSHEVKEEGYLVEADGHLVTIFSAPNYCDSVGNKGALIRFSPEMKPEYVQYSAVPHPPIRPMAYASNLFSNFFM